MKYAKKVMYVSDNSFLSKLDEKMNKILNQKIPTDEKVKLYNQVLETYMLNIPEKPEPPKMHDEDRTFLLNNLSKDKIHLHEDDRNFLVEKIGKDKMHLHDDDRNFLVNNLKKDNKVRLHESEKKFIAKQVKEAFNKLSKGKQNKNVEPEITEDDSDEDEEPRRRKLPASIDLENIVSGTRTRKPVAPTIKDTLRKQVLNNQHKKAKTSAEDTIYADANETLNQSGHGWISNKNYFS